jgi:hypothetical protein
MTTRATGPFDVKKNPQSEDKAGGSALGRLSLDKQFHGDAGLSGQMAINIVAGRHSYDLDYTLPSPS